MCFSVALIKTTSPNDICISFAWCNMLWLSLRALRYSFALVHAASLHLLIYYCRLFISGTSSSRSFSTYFKSQLFSVTSMSKTISSNYFWLRLVLPVVLYENCFTDPTFHSNCPPHHGALLKLNFLCISSLIEYFCISSSLLIFSIHFDAGQRFWCYLSRLLLVSLF